MEDEMIADKFSRLFKIFLIEHIGISLGLFVLGYFNYVPLKWGNVFFSYGVIALLLIGLVTVVLVIRDKNEVSSMKDIEGDERLNESHVDDGVVKGISKDITENEEEDEENGGVVAEEALSESENEEEN